MLKYKDVNPTVATSALAAFSRHLGYLSPEMVPLALFSDKVQADQRSTLAQSILAAKPDMTTMLFHKTDMELALESPSFHHQRISQNRQHLMTLCRGTHGLQ